MSNNKKWVRKMNAATGKNFDQPVVRAPHVFMPGVIPRELGAYLKAELRK